MQGVGRYPGQLAAELGEAGIASLMQLAILDLDSALAAGAAAVVTRSMQASHARVAKRPGREVPVRLFAPAWA